MATLHNTTSVWQGAPLASPWDWSGDLLWEQVVQYVKPLPPETPVDAQFELSPRTGIAMILTFSCGLLANAAGVGGGPFYIPIFNVLLGFSLKVSAALSLTIVSSGALASTIYGLHKKSPRDRNRTLLDFDLALTFLPALLFGVNFGVLFNVLIAEWLQTAILVFVLIFIIRNIARKARQQWDLEQSVLKQGLSPPVPPAVAVAAIEEPLLDRQEDVESNGNSFNDSVNTQRDTDGYARSCLDDIPNEESVPVPILGSAPRLQGGKTLLQRIPFRKVAALLLLYILFLVSQAQKSTLRRRSWEYAAIWGGQVAVLLAVAAAAIRYQVRKAERGDEDLDPEIRVILSHGASRESAARPITVLVQVACIMATAGMGAGLLGVGGAVFFNPSLLHLGVHPQVVVSTAVLMILFSSSAIALSLSFHNLLNYNYALVFAPLLFLASTIGVTVVGRIVRKSGRSSIIVIILTVLLSAGTLTTAVFGAWRSYHQMFG